jgi:hypothetical protein
MKQAARGVTVEDYNEEMRSLIVKHNQWVAALLSKHR